MPYQSKKQERFIKARAAAGESWAQRFVQHTESKRSRKKRPSPLKKMVRGY